MLSPFIEACGDGKYRLISARAGNQSKESLHKSLARLLDTDAIFPERDEGFWQKLENRATEKHIQITICCSLSDVVFFHQIMATDHAITL